jgi:hypothetical protein
MPLCSSDKLLLQRPHLPLPAVFCLLPPLVKGSTIKTLLPPSMRIICMVNNTKNKKTITLMIIQYHYPDLAQS